MTVIVVIFSSSKFNGIIGAQQCIFNVNVMHFIIIFIFFIFLFFHCNDINLSNALICAFKTLPPQVLLLAFPRISEQWHGES